jgi:hypothetical protein
MRPTRFPLSEAGTSARKTSMPGRTTAVGAVAVTASTAPSFVPAGTMAGFWTHDARRNTARRVLVIVFVE